MRGGMVVDQSVLVERAEDVDKEKKKKRRNRRPKQNSSFSACSSNSEMRGEGSEHLGNASGSNSMDSSMSHYPSNHDGVGIKPPSEHEMTKASQVTFISLPPMYLSEGTDSSEVRSMEKRPQYPFDYDGRMCSKSCPVTISCEEVVGSSFNGQPFDSHWSMEVVKEALEKGNAFRALFHVNAHNRMEAYCKIDGVPTDILISGFAAQNRAVEGDIVAIEVDPLSSWANMKGSARPSSNSTPVEDPSLLLEVNGVAEDSCNVKTKVGTDYENGHCRNGIFLPGEELFHGTRYGEESSGYSHINGNYSVHSEYMHVGCSSDQQNEVIDSLGKLCSSISSYPLRRPTGRVVAIIERSPRRDAVVGFLGFKQWFSHRESYRKDTRKNKTSFSLSDHEYIQLTPTDPKFPKLRVPVRGLPDCIRKRVEDGDVTVEMELVAAQIDSWGEWSPAPQARVVHAFGRAGEMEPHIAAILFENMISTHEFSPESFSCIPCAPWVVPLEELKIRRDLRNMCIFTIDPSTATDLDDALSVESFANGIVRVGVHIADVSYFVLPDSPLDTEAKIRSTSVYLLRHKLPMLPPLLSENVGSLIPGVDRLAFSIFWDINIAGDVVDRWIGRTVIRSCCKLSYEHAQDIIDGKFEVDNSSNRPQLHGHFGWPDVIRSVNSLHRISKILKENRFNDGALRLESSKVVFLFDECGVPYDSVLCEQKDSSFLVEEFMLLANRTAAEVISRAFPKSALLRRHPEPNLRKLRELEMFCSKNGFELDTSSAGQLHQSLERIQEKLKNDSVLFDIIISYATKPMQLAAYFCSGDLKVSENDWGHYGLGVPLYTHFTAPLRRYPDIVVHRTLAAVIEAEEMYVMHQKTLQKVNKEEETRRGFTGIYFYKNAVDSKEGREALLAAAKKYRIPCTEILADVAVHCNKRKLASRHVKDACDRLYMWVLLKKKQILLSQARVLGLGPRFMSVYIHKLAIERRIYYDEVEGLTVKWLETTSTLVINYCTHKRPYRRGSPGKFRTLEDVALVVSPHDLISEMGVIGNGPKECNALELGDANTALKDFESISKPDTLAMEFDPPVFPLTVHLLSTIPVALHAVGGDDGPIDIGARLYMSSYFK